MNHLPGGPLLIDLLRDIRYGARLLARSPGFAVAAVVSLALGIGANTTMFAALDVMLLKRLPVADPATLAVAGPFDEETRFDSMPYPRFARLFEQSHPASVSSAAAVWHIERMNLSTEPGTGSREAGAEGALGADGGRVRVGLVSGR